MFIIQYMTICHGLQEPRKRRSHKRADMLNMTNGKTSVRARIRNVKLPTPPCMSRLNHDRSAQRLFLDPPEAFQMKKFSKHKTLNPKP